MDLSREKSLSSSRRAGERRVLIRGVVDQLPLQIRWELEILEKLGLAPADLFERLTESLASSVAQAFSVHDDEVAILLLKNRRLTLRFAYPLVLYLEQTNMFPVNAPSIAGDVLRNGRGRIDNNVAETQHLSIYERIAVNQNRPREIQKMISTPLLSPSASALGVMQVSRKGNSAEEAEPNFSSRDLLKLNDLSRWLAPHIQKAVPSDF